MNNLGATQVRQTEVSKAIGDLHSVIEIAGKEVDELGALLERVRTPKPEVAKNATCPPEPKKCDLASVITNCAGNIAIMVEHIKTIKNELEL